MAEKGNNVICLYLCGKRMSYDLKKEKKKRKEKEI